MTYGTSYFTSLSAAIRYYKDYGDDAASVRSKIRQGSIHIGKPPLKPGERLGTTDGGKRYTITEAPKIPNGRLVPARLRTRNGRTFPGKVKRVNGKVKIYVTPQVARKINPSAFYGYIVEKNASGKWVVRRGRPEDNVTIASGRWFKFKGAAQKKASSLNRKRK